VFDLAKFDIEAWLMEEQKSTLAPTAGDTPWRMAADIETWLGQMEEDLRDVIWENQKQAYQKLDLVSRFTNCLGPHDTVLTFNYDTLVEDSLSNLQKPWSQGFSQEQADGTTILKMHGSIDWIITHRGNVSSFKGATLLFRKEFKNNNQDYDSGSEVDRFELLRVPHNRLASFIEKRDLQWQSTFYEIAIAGLGSYKPLHVLPGIGEVWFNAMKALQEAEEIYIVGFSLSPFDNMVRLHFGGVMCERDEKKDLSTKVTLVDPYAHQLQENFRSVFGPDISMKICKQKAEETDWVQLLEK